jgi:hypothetical protein
MKQPFVIPCLALIGLLIIPNRTQAQNASIVVHADQVEHPLSRLLTGACIEDVNHEVCGGIDSQMIFSESFADPAPSSSKSTDSVSGSWRAFRRGSAVGRFSLDEQNPFVGRQSQRMSFASGRGEIGIENQGLNRWGMHFVKGKGYEGYIWARTQLPTEVFISLESRDGSVLYAQKRLKLDSGRWQRLDFTLKPNAADTDGRFALKLKQ